MGYSERLSQLETIGMITTYKEPCLQRKKTANWTLIFLLSGGLPLKQINALSCHCASTDTWFILQDSNDSESIQDKICLFLISNEQNWIYSSACINYFATNCHSQNWIPFEVLVPLITWKNHAIISSSIWYFVNKTLPL